MFKTESIAVYRPSKFMGSHPLLIEIGITAGESRQDICDSPPSALALLWLAEGLGNHLLQCYSPLIRLVLLQELLYLIIVKPETLIVFNKL